MCSKLQNETRARSNQRSFQISTKSTAVSWKATASGFNQAGSPGLTPGT